MTRLIKILASVFGLGYSTIAPGTNGTLAGIIIYLLVYRNTYLYLGSAVFVILLGFLICGRAERAFGGKDSQKIVIDELAGILVAYLFVRFNFFNLALGFIFYRLFDILKPPPIHKLEKLPGSMGVMLDDLMAGVYTCAILNALKLLRL
ncbi:MAG: phosphatidylglycerophosphatase A [Candidatus Omnitrophota bacterium]